MADAAAQRKKLTWLKAQLAAGGDDSESESDSSSDSDGDGETVAEAQGYASSAKVKADDSGSEENDHKQRPRRASRKSSSSVGSKTHSRHRSESEHGSSDEDPTSPVTKRVRKKEKKASSKTAKRTTSSSRHEKESGAVHEHDDAEQQTKASREHTKQQKAEQREVAQKERERLKQQKAEQRERKQKEKAEIREMAIKAQECVQQEKAELRAKKLEAAARKDNAKDQAHGAEKDAGAKTHRKALKKPVSDSEEHSSSSASESPMKKATKVRKREIASKERNDVVFAGIDAELIERDADAVKGERAVKRSKASAGVHARERHDDGTAARSSRKRPLASSKAVKGGKLVLNEASADIRDRPHSAKREPREHENRDDAAAKSSAVQQEESAPLPLSIPNDKSHRKEDGAVKAPRKRVVSQEDEDRRLAIALSSRKSERARKRAHSSDSTAPVDPAAQVEVRVVKKRKREAQTEVSNGAALEGVGVDKPEKPKSRTLKKHSASGALNSVVSAVTPSSAEKVPPTRKIRQKASTDASPQSAADPVNAETKKTSASPKERRDDRAELHHRQKEDGERKYVRSKVHLQSESDRAPVKKVWKKSMDSGGVEERAKQQQKADEVDAAAVDPAEGKDDAMPANEPTKSPKGILPQVVDAKAPEQLAQDESASPGAATPSTKLKVKEESADQVPKNPPAVVEPDSVVAGSVDQKKPESGDESTIASSPKPTTPVAAQDEKPAEEREDGEEEEEGAIAEGRSEPKQEAKPDVAKPESNAESAPVDPMSFVIPKKKIQRKPQGGALQNAVVSTAVPPAISIATKPAPGSSPVARDLESKEANFVGNAQARAPPRRKNYVPVAATPLTREEKEFMRRAKKMNSLFGACSRSPRTGDTAGPYAVFDSNGSAIPDFLPRMKYPTKKQLKAQSAAYPASFFGVEMKPPSAVATDAETESSLNPDPVSGVEINVYEPLEFARPSDREAYQKKMYGTTFVPQSLRGRTTLVMRNVVFERKSTGIRFNADRDREEFARVLSERFTVNKSVPRCEIPPKNWQQLMNKRPAVVYVHYQNREDGELAAQICRDDKNMLLERKRTNRVGGIISASNSPAPQMTPRRSLSTDRSGPEASPPVSNRNASGLDSKSTPQPWQPHNDLRRRDDDTMSRGPRDSRDWPPRYNGRGRGGDGHRAADRARDRDDYPPRRQLDQRFGDDETMQQGHRRSRSRSRSRQNSAREYPNDESSYRGADGDAGRQGDYSQEFSDHRDAPHQHSENSASEPSSQSRAQSQQHTQDSWDSENQNDAHQRKEDTQDRRDRSESVEKQHDADASGSNSRDRRGSQERAEQEERSVNGDRDGGAANSEMRTREQPPSQERHHGATDDNDSRYHSQEHHPYHSGSFDWRRDDETHYRNDHVNDARGARSGDFEFRHERHGHSRGHGGRSRSRPRGSPHMDRAANYRHEPEFGHDRHGSGHFDNGEFRGRDSHHYPYDHDRAFHRHGPRDDGYPPRQRGRPY